MDYLCDVIILSWNQLQATKNCIESLLANTKIPTRLIIIDNNSQDGTRQYLSSLKDTNNHRFKIVLNETNYGFIKGVNQGIELADAPYVCIANNDLIFTQGWLSPIMTHFKMNRDIGILNPNSNNLGAHPPKGVSLQDFAKSLKAKYKGVFIEMPFCIGFCMVVREEVIDKVGQFCEEFYPMFFEDSDYSQRVKRGGYLIGMAKDSYVWHVEHTSLKPLGDEKKEEIFAKSREIFLSKWGKILRIAWIIDNYDALKENLEAGISLAREGNFVWFLGKGIKVNREEVFKKNGFFEHSGINFIKISNIFDLVYKIVKKKKRYDIIITNNRGLQLFFAWLKYRVLTHLEQDTIRQLKGS